MDIFDEFGEPDDTTERDPPNPSPGPWHEKFAKLCENRTTVGRCYICQQEKLIDPQTSVCMDCTRLARAEGR
jgi:hypothetical protein